MSRRVRRALAVGLGIFAALAILAVLALAGDSAVDVVCVIGTNLDQPAYERCISELPALQAQHAEEMRVRTAMRPVVALAGGVAVALAAYLMVRSQTPKHPPVEDDPWTVGGGARTG
jgi:threonine/homoserine/homoserine lactone efflux protein